MSSVAEIDEIVDSMVADATGAGATSDAAKGTTRKGGRMPQRTVAAVVIVLALGAAGFTRVQANHAEGLAQARTDALAAAQQRVPDLLSYDEATLDDDLVQALDQTTGDFTTDYAKILEEVVKPTAGARKISTRAAVSAAGVVSGTRDEVVVLLFLTQTTTAGKSDTSVSGSRIEVTMRRDGDTWKIAGIQPV